jgi:hypothetical protein
MARGRKASLDPPVEWTVNVPSSIAVQIDLLLSDPLTGKPRYGARAKLVTALLQHYLRTARTNPNLTNTHTKEN